MELTYFKDQIFCENHYLQGNFKKLKLNVKKIPSMFNQNLKEYIQLFVKKNH